MGTVYVQGFIENPGGSVTYGSYPVLSSEGRAQAAAGVGVTEDPTGLKSIAIPLTNVAMTMTKDGANGGHTNKLLFTFPRGIIYCPVVYVNLTIVADAKLTATSAIVGALGTAPTAIDNPTLLSTEANIVPSTTCTLTDNAGAFAYKTATYIAPLDGKTTAPPCYLNFATPDAGITETGGVLTVNGTIEILWMAT
jgi:hypothetical protein